MALRPGAAHAARLVPACTALAAVLASELAAAQCGPTDDAFEQNDDCATAHPVTAPWTQGGLRVDKVDADHFVFTARADDEVRVRVRFDDELGDIDAYLYLASGPCGDPYQYLDRGVSNSDDELLFWENDTGADVELVLRVEIWPGSIPECNTYEVELTAEPPQDPCDSASLDDGFEENDSCAEAVPLPLGLTQGLWMSRVDHDFYSARVEAGATLTVDAFFVDNLGDIDLFLYDAAGPCGGGFGSGELARGFTSNDDERIVWSNTGGTPADVVLHVSMWQFDDCNTYDMLVDLDGQGIGVNYCQAAANSTGQPGLISAAGSTRVSDDDVTLQARQLPPNAAGYFLTSRTRGFLPGVGGTAGNLCLGGDIGRWAGDVLDSGATGEFSLAIDLHALPQPSGNVAVLPGESWFFQAWHRDSSGGQPTSNLTNALAIGFE